MKFPVFFCSLFFAAITVQAQKNALTIDTALAAFKNQYPQEKVFLQTDKDFYIAGETIWMKAWCLLEEAPTYLSQIVYVDMVDNSGKVVLKKMYRLDSLGSTGADFELSKDIPSGTYAINAYTMWMLNFPDFLFKKNIVVYGEDHAVKVGGKKPLNTRTSIQFFPEGGNIISGVINRMAFKATDINGFPVNIVGEIKDAEGKKVAGLTSEHDGMGTVEFLVEKGKEYFATVSANKGSFIAKLPKAKEEGFAVKIENTNPNRLFVLVSRTENGKENFGKIKAVATTNYAIVFSAQLDLDNGETAFSIPKKNLPPGILHITFFDSKNLPFSERLAFIENYDLLHPSITIEHKNLKAKSKNQVSFQLQSEMPSLSCLVTSYDEKDSVLRYIENIASALLATSDLKGYIHQPGYYFKDKSATTLRALDLLLMTQGWRRFEWNKIQQNQFNAITYPVESAISFRGSVYKSDSKEKVTDGKVSFVIKGIDSTSILAEAAVTDKGEFLLKDIHYIKNAMVSYMGTNNKKSNYIVDVKLLPNYIDTLKTGSRPSVQLDTFTNTQAASALENYLRRNLDELEKGVKSKVMDAVVIKTKKLTPTDSLNNAYAGGPFLMGKGINPAEFNNYRTIWQMIQAAVPGITVEGNPFDPVVSMNRFSGLGGQSSATVAETTDGELSESGVMETSGIAYFLNEVNVSKDVINTLTVEDIALIKVLKNEAAALGATQGAIAIYTKQGATIGKNVYDKNYTTLKMEGYAINKEFYQPEYSYNPSSQEADNRYTLYWSAKLLPAKDGKYRFQFYNNSFGSKARLVIQGLDKNGKLVYVEQIIE
ncbi:MAG: hypothetical protein EOO06_10080 [Chitinophagaceae bacterium]|nr:MAG: hypothetical protein EOO06_10080 [Chitinophagaceae bacterium]